METVEREFICPGCGAHMLAPGDEHDVPLTVTCPECGQLLTIEPCAPVDVSDLREDELDAARIDRYSRMRRSLYRSRSHAVIGAVVCAVAAAQLFVMASRRASSRAGSVAMTAAALLFVVGAILLFRRAVQLNREAQRR